MKRGWMRERGGVDGVQLERKRERERESVVFCLFFMMMKKERRPLAPFLRRYRFFFCFCVTRRHFFLNAGHLLCSAGGGGARGRWKRKRERKQVEVEKKKKKKRAKKNSTLSHRLFFFFEGGVLLCRFSRSSKHALSCPVSVCVQSSGAEAKERAWRGSLVSERETTAAPSRRPPPIGRSFGALFSSLFSLSLALFSPSLSLARSLSYLLARL